MVIVSTPSAKKNSAPAAQNSTMFVVLLLWDSHQLTGIIVLAAAFLAIGVGLAIGVYKRMHRRSRLFSASLDELTKDKDRLTSR